MAEDKKKEPWLTTLILQMKINSIPYIIKTLIFLMIVAIIHLFSDSEIAKILSVITYTAGMTIDAYFLSKNCITNSQKLEVYLFIHMFIIIAGTLASVILLIKVSVDVTFASSTGYQVCNCLVNLFLLYATITPLLEAMVNSNNNQLTNSEHKKETMNTSINKEEESEQ